MSKESVEIAIDGFSGPLDLLCHLVESHQMQASKIRVAQLVRIYGAYLLKTKKASVDALAEFFFMVAGLLLQKTLSLLPDATSAFPEDDMEELLPDEEELLEKLARYRPYRSATLWLEERKNLRERRFRRILSEEADFSGEPAYDIGDLYFLSRIWWGLIDRFRKENHRERNNFVFEDMEEEWNGMPEAVPEESQIQSRIAELEEKLALGVALSLNELWAVSPSVRMLVVTLLAVLEMCRMGRIYIEQETLFSDVKICAKG